jgi:hypothetical protein
MDDIEKLMGKLEPVKYRIDWYRAAGLFLLGLSTALMITLTIRVLT